MVGHYDVMNFCLVRFNSKAVQKHAQTSGSKQIDDCSKRLTRQKFFPDCNID